jgi:TP901 family phage tail tape measure protein
LKSFEGLIYMQAYMNISVRVITAQGIAQIKALEAQLKALSAQMGKSSIQGGNFLHSAIQPLAKFGNQLQWTGRQLQYNFTLPILLAGGAATKFALDNETAFTKIAKVYGDASLSAATMRNELAALKKSFTALSNQYGIQQSEVLDIAAAWAAAGASGVALAKSTEQTLKTMILGEMGATEATDALISIQSQYNLSTAQLTDTIAKLNIIENQTGISMAGLVQGFARAAGTARSAGIDVDHLGAFLAALTPASGSASQAGNALKTIISRLLSPTKDAVDILKAMGVSITDLSWKSANGSQRIELLSKKFHNLDDAQKAVVSSTLASRYQINRFDVLMDSVYKSVDNNTKSQGYYGKALDATANRTAYLQQAQKELQMVLESNPQKLKQTWVILQNAMADVIIPLIPMILMLANTVKVLAEKFRDLPPEIQKATTFGLLFLALFGPLIRYIGAVITLGTELVWMFGGIATAIIAPFKYLKLLLALPYNALASGLLVIRAGLMGLLSASMYVVGAFSSMIGSFLTFVGVVAGGPLRALYSVVTSVFMLMGRNLVVIWSRSFVTLRSLTALGAGGIGAIWTIFSTNMVRTATVLWSNLTALFVLGGRAVAMAFNQTFGAMAIVTRAFFTNLAAMFAIGWRSVILVTRLSIIGIGVMITELPAIIAAAGPAIAAGFEAVAGAIIAVFTSPIGLAVAAVVAVVYLFRKQIGQVIGNIIDEFNQLPVGVYNAVKQVVDIVKAAALAVYGWFSYLNPFAHHSPSLVENVTNGMAAVVTQFGTLSQISGPISKAYRDIKAFGLATKGLASSDAAAKHSDDRSKIAKVDPGALKSFDALIGDLNRLQGILASLNAKMDKQQAIVDKWTAALKTANAALDKQQDKLDKLQSVLDKANDNLSAAQDSLSKFANTPIKGMQAMSDAIFDNDQAQKALQLQMMKIEDVTGPISDVTDKMAKLRGEVETLQGTQASLRQAGAGSDILDTYKQQITGLQGQETATQDSLKAYQDMSDALDKLQRQGQELDLENSLEFDPLTRQIEAAANAMTEMPFDQIMKGVQGAQKDIKKYSDAVDAASKAVDKQKIAVGKATAARDKIQAQLDKEQDKLDKLKDQYDKVNNAIQDINSSLNDMTQAATNAISAAAAAAKKAKGPAGPASGSALSNFNIGKGGNFPSVAGTGSLGREGSSADQTAAINKYTSDLAKQTSDMLGSFDMFAPIKKKWKQATKWLSENVKPLLHPFLDLVTGAFDGVDFGAPFRSINLDGIKQFGKTLMDMLKTVVSWGQSLWKLLGPEVMKSIDAIVGGAKDLWKQIAPELIKFKDLLKPAADAFNVLWEIAKPVLATLGILLLGLIKIVWSTFNGGIKPVFDLIGGVIAGLIRIFRGMVEIILAILTGDWTLLWKGIGDVVSGTWKVIWSVISSGVKLVVGLIVGFVKGIWGWMKWLYDELVGHSIIPDLVKGIISWFKKLGEIPAWIYNNVLKPIYDKIKSWWTGVVKPYIKAVYDGWTAIFHGLDALPGWIWTNVLVAAYNKIKTWWNGSVKPYIGAVRDGFNTIFHSLSSLPGWLYDNAFKPVYDRLKKVWDNYLKPFGNTMIRGFANIFNSIGHAIVAGVNIGIGAINKLISGLNWVGSHVPGLKFSLGSIDKAAYSPFKAPQFAKGGHLPYSEVGAGFKTHGARAIVGEGNAAYPEFVIPTDPKYRGRASDLLTQAANSMGIGQFASGGVLDGIKGAIDKVGSTIRKGAVSAVFKPINAAIKPLMAKIDNRMHLRDIPEAGIKKIQSWASGVNNALPDKDSFAPGAPGNVSGNAAIVRDVFANQFKWTAANWDSAYQLIMHESGFNNTAQNPTSTAYGMFQFLDSTWGGVGGHKTSDPKLQAIYGGRYIKNAYGNPISAWSKWQARSPHWYDNGGLLKPGMSMTMNGTGKTEAVLTDGQWSGILRLADASATVGAQLPTLVKSVATVVQDGAAARASYRADAVAARQDTTVQGASGGTTEIHFHGDLSFPAVKTGADAQKFISNLEILARGA